MRTVIHIIRKEFLQIRRNRTLLPLIFLLPVVQLIVLVYAADMNLKRIEYAVVDQDNSQVSRALQAKYQHSPFFDLKLQLPSVFEAQAALQKGEADLVVVIPRNFEKNLATMQKVEVQFLVDGINSNAAVLVSAYAQNIFRTFQLEMAQNQGVQSKSTINPIQISYRHWFNEELDFKIYMVPGILVLLVSMVGWILTALNIVREKELGTIEQINVTPIGKAHFILGKLIPFWIIALFELSIGLLIGKLLFGVPILGSLGVIFLFTGVYLFVPLGFGLLISALSQNQQQVMFLTFFFIITFVLMSGLFTPIESMPNWAQTLNYLNPLAYFMKVNRMILLKGSGFVDILPEFLGILIYGVLIVFLATRAYRKREA